MRLRLVNPGAAPELRKIVREAIGLAEQIAEPDQPLTEDNSVSAEVKVARATIFHSIRHAKAILHLDAGDLADTAPTHNRVLYENAVNLLFMMTDPKKMADRLWRWGHVSAHKILNVALESQKQKKDGAVWNALLADKARVAEIQQNYRDYLSDYGVRDKQTGKTVPAKTWSGLGSIAAMVSRLKLDYWAYSIMSMEVHGDISVIGEHFTPVRDGKIYHTPDMNEPQVLAACAIYMAWASEALLKALGRDTAPAYALLEQIKALCALETAVPTN